jgi:hypothetical protein
MGSCCGLIELPDICLKRRQNHENPQSGQQNPGQHLNQGPSSYKSTALLVGQLAWYDIQTHICCKQTLRIIPTERPPLVGDFSANFCG